MKLSEFEETMEKRIRGFYSFWIAKHQKTGDDNLWPMELPEAEWLEQFEAWLDTELEEDENEG